MKPQLAIAVSVLENDDSVLFRSSDYICSKDRCFSKESLRSVFDSMSSKHGLTREQFVELCVHLNLGMSTVEIGRVWNQLGVVKGGSISFEQFAWAIARRRLLRRIVSAYLRESLADETLRIVPDDYDYARPTCENYAVAYDSATERRQFESSSKFAKQRELLDYSYHPLYSAERRAWQDAVVHKVAVRTEPQTTPWLVYTMGPMGAGKGYALHWLSEHGYFPLEDIVHVDPDRFKEMMPEWPGYIRRDKLSAGTKCHRESGLLAEITQEVAMTQRQHVWFDGSLRNAPYFREVFQRIRRSHPTYRIAIFYVYASEKVAWRRAQARAALTGRAIPESVFKDSLEAPAESLKLLTPYVDFLARISNEDDGQPPKLIAFETVDSSGDLARLRRCFADSEPDAEFAHFPQRRGPLRLVKCFDGRLTTTKGDPWCVELDGDLAKRYGSSCVVLLGDAPHALTWSPSVRNRADVPPDALFFAFCIPCEDDGTAAEDLAALRANGGIAYLDLQHRVIRLVAFVSDDEPSTTMLRFDLPTLLPSPAARVLAPRWRDLPDRHLARDAGATATCWIAPCEDLGGTRYAPYGGQAFLFANTNITRTGSFGTLGEEEVAANGTPRRDDDESLLLFPIRGTA